MIITIEGIDRSGKTTQTAMLVKWLRTQGYVARSFSFPDYTTPVGVRIGEHLRSGRTDPKVLHALMAENRLEKLKEIRQAISDMQILVMNRYCESNMVYGRANGLDSEWLASLDHMMPKSQAVILLDVDLAESFQRGADSDSFESDHEFLERVAEGYRLEAQQNCWSVVSGSDAHTVHKEVVVCAKKAIKECGLVQKSAAL